MGKLILIAIALAFTSSSALAEWKLLANAKQLVGNGDQQHKVEFQLFLDDQFRQATGGKVDFWLLKNYSEPQYSAGARAATSTISRYEISCVGQTFQILSSTDYAEPMGKGSRISSFGGPEDKTHALPPLPITPSSTMAFLFNNVCSR